MIFVGNIMVIIKNKWRYFLLLLICFLFISSLGFAAEQNRALREVAKHQVQDLGLEIWVENQPSWETAVVPNKDKSMFSAQSPRNYHPPSAMTFMSWPKQTVKPELLETVAVTAIRSGARNFGLHKAAARGVKIVPKQYGVLAGYEGNFVGQAQGMQMDVKVFVGQKTGKFPVVLTIYTLKGKMGHLNEVIRRSWTNISYLKR